MVGSGKNVKFWDDRWCEDQPLKVGFPSLYDIALVPSTMVNDVLAIHNRSLNWSIVFGWGLQDWNLISYVLFLTSLHEVHIRVGEDDRSRWVAWNDIFSVCTDFRSLSKLVKCSFP